MAEVPVGDVAIMLIACSGFLDCWRVFCYYLGFNGDDAKLFAKQYFGIEFPCYFSLINGILEAWVSRNGRNATIGTLTDIALKLNNRAMRDSLTSKYPDPNTLITTPENGSKVAFASYQQNLSAELRDLIEKLKLEDQNQTQKPGGVKVLQALPDVNGSRGRVVIFLSHLLRILSKVGNRPVVIISINGRMRTGKSFMANQFLKYLKFSKDCEGNWLDCKIDKGFDWGGGSERVTSGIEMWFEPFIVKENDTELAVILMDTQGLYDMQTDSQENKIIFGFSALISSVFIYNEKCVDSQILQDLHASLEFAKMGDTNENGTKFQKLILLLRDWDVNTFQYPYGYYYKNKKTEKNLLDFIFGSNPGKSKDVGVTRNGILNSFQDVSVYAMSHPCKTSPELESRAWDQDFRTTIVEFVEILFCSDNLQQSVKTVSGEQVTGEQLKIFVKKWAELIEEFDGGIEFNTIFETTAKMIYSKRIEGLVEQFRNDGNKQISQYPTGTEQAIFNKFLEDKKSELANEFETTKSYGGSEIKANFKMQLLERINKILVQFVEINHANLIAEEERKRLEQIRLENERIRLEQEKQQELRRQREQQQLLEKQRLEEERQRIKETQIRIADEHLQLAQSNLQTAIARRDEVIRNQQNYRSPHEVKKTNRIMGIKSHPTRYTEWRYDPALYNRALDEANADVYNKQVQVDTAYARLVEARNS